MAAAYVLAGINHFVHPEMYLAIMPPWIPAHSFLVFFSGILELVLGVLLLPLCTRRVAAWGLVILLLLVFPANMQMMINYNREGHPLLWLAVLRLALQIPLLWWAYQYTKPVEK
jgi:uncharacterized membrane protein